MCGDGLQAFVDQGAVALRKELAGPRCRFSREIDQSPSLAVTVFGQFASTLVLTGILGPNINAQIGHEGIVVVESVVNERSSAYARFSRQYALTV